MMVFLISQRRLLPDWQYFILMLLMGFVTSTGPREFTPSLKKTSPQIIIYILHSCSTGHVKS